MVKVNWNRYGTCPICAQESGFKCISLLHSAKDKPTVYKKFPHKERRHGTHFREVKMRNIELLDKVIEKIEADPETWNQNAWAIGSGTNAVQDDGGKWNPGPECDTAFCVAGYVALLTGAKFEWHKSDSGRLEAWRVIDENGNKVRVSEYAQEKLGLSYFEADDLFSYRNSLDTIKHFRDAFARRNQRELED